MLNDATDAITAKPYIQDKRFFNEFFANIFRVNIGPKKIRLKPQKKNEDVF